MSNEEVCKSLNESKNWRVEADGEILLDPDLEKEEKFKTKEDALDFIGFLDYEHEWDNWDNPDIQVVNIKTGEREKVDIKELHKKLNEQESKLKGD